MVGGTTTMFLNIMNGWKEISARLCLRNQNDCQTRSHKQHTYRQTPGKQGSQILVAYAPGTPITRRSVNWTGLVRLFLGSLPERQPASRR